MNGLQDTGESRSSARRVGRLRGSLALAALATTVVTGTAGAATGWSGPTRIASGDFYSVETVVDGTGAIHAVSQRGSDLVYATNASGSWTQVTITDPVDRRDYMPSLAVDSAGKAHVAFARFCEPCYETEGIFYITNKLGGPNAGWPTSATLLATGHLYDPSLQVRGGAIHLAYVGDDALPRYRNNASGSWVTKKVSTTRWAQAGVSLRVGSDGDARIAFSDFYGGIYYARNIGTDASPVFNVSKVPGTADMDAAPSLDLDSTNRPHIAWQRLPDGVTCFAPGAVTTGCGPLRAQAPATSGVGIYYATVVGSAWTPTSQRRISTRLSSPNVELAVTPTGKAHIAIEDDYGVHHFTNKSGSFVRTLLTATGAGIGVDIDLKPNGKPRVVFIRDPYQTANPGLYLSSRN